LPVERPRDDSGHFLRRDGLLEHLLKALPLVSELAVENWLNSEAIRKVGFGRNAPPTERCICQQSDGFSFESFNRPS
jgi:hypothetical protein